MDIIYRTAMNILDKDPQSLAWFNRKIRANKVVIMHACKKDHTLVRHAIKEMWKDTAFVYVTQDNDPKKLKALLEKYPEVATDKLSAVVAVYEDPITFTELPKEAFKDRSFICTCKHAIGARLKEMIGNDIPSKSEIGIANSIYRLVRETEELRKLENGQIKKMEYVVEHKSAKGIIQELQKF